MKRRTDAVLLSDKERYEKVIEIWNKTTDDVADALMESLDSLNNLFIMANSGARGSKNQITSDRRYAWSDGECNR